MPPPPPEPTVLARRRCRPRRPSSGYTIDEIHEVTRGFFGTISTSLGSVIEYAFHKSGRPDGYVLGTEGGGAFLAGVRYGSGTLYLRSGGTAKVYWHGPSIGTDFGASGSRTMFLIYNLRDPNDLIREFTGIDGSAYFVGGVGITFLKGGAGAHGADPLGARLPHRRQPRLHPLHAAPDLEPVLVADPYQLPP